ncbi:MAG: AAA family ATPase [Deltaproteobacteria bacterium]|nr:AAA family ATPase [Deltaproteobacteria bacterium]
MNSPKKRTDFGKLVVEPPFGPTYFLILQSAESSIGHARSCDVVLLDSSVSANAGLLTVASNAVLLSRESEAINFQNDDAAVGSDVFLDETRSATLGRTQLKYWPPEYERTQQELAILSFSEVACFPAYDDVDVFRPAADLATRNRELKVSVEKTNEAFSEAQGALKAELKATTENVAVAVEEGDVLDVTSDEQLLVANKSQQPRLLSLKVAAKEPMSASWEGATIFIDVHFFDEIGSGDEKRLRYSGDVVEVDADEDRIFILLHPVVDGELKILRSASFRGEGYIQPFAFLKDIVDLYHHDDERNQTRLKMALQKTQLSWWNAHALVERRVKQGDVESLVTWLKSHPWAILWGPPGTGKTTSIATLVSRLLDDSNERILVVSTTNRATDGVALAIGKAVRQKWPGSHLDESIARVGRGAKANRFRGAHLEDLVGKSLMSSQEELTRLEQDHEAATDSAAKAKLAKEIRKQRLGFQSRSRLFCAAQSRVVISTAHQATRLIAKDIEKQRLRGQAPFTLVVLDEAGLLSRAQTAALSLLSSRGVLLVGDPKQLAPIASLTRLLPSAQMRWLSQSALEDLDANKPPPHCHLLHKQYRMHKTIGEAVSKFQYDGQLLHDEKNDQLELDWDPLLKEAPRAIWVVLDGQKENRGRFAATRGAQNASWERPAALEFLKLLFENHPRLRTMNGLFLSPFVAQVKTVKKWLTTEKLSSWYCSSVHQQQGAEADVVIFDAVNAASNGFSHFEWKRLINVAMSRARRQFFLLASKQEMAQPHTRALPQLLTPSTLRGRGSRAKWTETAFVSPKTNKGPLYDDKSVFSENADDVNRGLQLRKDTPSLGTQLAALDRRNPILSAEQSALCNLQLDHKPRLVRGVPGSGKTIVLAHWLAKTLLNDDIKDIWVVFGNRTLEGLLRNTATNAFHALGGDEFPADRVRWQHIGEVLSRAEQQLGLATPQGPDFFHYDNRSANLLAKKKADDDEELPFRAQVLFVDEAQDLGPRTLHLLSDMVEQRDVQDPNSRAMLIFYDNAQDLYRRGRPNWTNMGLNFQGRSRVMKVSHRSTQPILSFAFNVRSRLCDLDKDEDQIEQAKMGLIKKETRQGRLFWQLRYSDIQGPAPTFQVFSSRKQEFFALATRIKRLLHQEHILSSQIVVIALFKKMHDEIAAAFTNLEISSTREMRPSQGILICTPHAFKGHEAEFVFVVAADCFTAPFNAPNEASEEQKQQGELFSETSIVDVNASVGVDVPSKGPEGQNRAACGRQILAASLYVALTRARSLLYISAAGNQEPAAKRIVEVLQQVKEDLRAPSDEE